MTTTWCCPRPAHAGERSPRRTGALGVTAPTGKGASGRHGSVCTGRRSNSQDGTTVIADDDYLARAISDPGADKVEGASVDHAVQRAERRGGRRRDRVHPRPRRHCRSDQFDRRRGCVWRSVRSGCWRPGWPPGSCRPRRRHSPIQRARRTIEPRSCRSSPIRGHIDVRDPRWRRLRRADGRRGHRRGRHGVRRRAVPLVPSGWCGAGEPELAGDSDEHQPERRDAGQAPTTWAPTPLPTGSRSRRIIDGRGTTIAPTGCSRAGRSVPSPGDQILEGVIPLEVDGVPVAVTVASRWEPAASTLPMWLGGAVRCAVRRRCACCVAGVGVPPRRGSFRRRCSRSSPGCGSTCRCRLPPALARCGGCSRRSR